MHYCCISNRNSSQNKDPTLFAKLAPDIGVKYTWVLWVCPILDIGDPNKDVLGHEYAPTSCVSDLKSRLTFNHRRMDFSECNEQLWLGAYCTKQEVDLEVGIRRFPKTSSV